MKCLIPNGVTWIKDSVIELMPESNSLKVSDSKTFTYDYLILSPGLKVDFEKIKGLSETLGKNGVCSIYDYHQCEKTFEILNSVKSGKALFTVPPMPVKCAGAPQKIMYLAEELFRDNGVREKTEVHFYSNSPAIFGVPLFSKALEKVAARKNIQTHFLQKLVEIKAEQKIAVFEKVSPPPVPVAPGCAPVSLPTDPHLGEKTEVKFDVLHVVPPNSPPDFIAKSSLAWTDGAQKGWLEVDQYTLQCHKFKNVFGLGDVLGTPNAKTGAAIRKQVPLLIENLASVIEGKPLTNKYDGYSSCPLITSKHTVMLAEFGYDGKILPSFPLDPTKERYVYWLLKRYLLPKIYWWGMLKGLL